MKQPPPFQHAPLKFTAKKCPAKKFLRRVSWLSASCGHEDQAEGTYRSGEYRSPRRLQTPGTQVLPFAI
jgi:hypothetical protein